MEDGPREWQMFYKGYHDRFVNDCILPLQGGKVQVKLAQAPSARAAQKTRKGEDLDKASDPALTGTTVWDGAIVLSHLLADTNILAQHEALWAAKLAAAEAAAAQLREASTDDNPMQPALPPPVRPRLSPLLDARHLPAAVELGAGTGAVSLSLLASRKVSTCTLTDLPDLLPHLKLNIDRNKNLFRPHTAIVKALHWGPPGDDLAGIEPGTFDLIVGSDLIYYTYSEETPHSKWLLYTLERMAGPYTVIYLALSLHHNPEEVEHFLSLAEEGGFKVERLHEEIPEAWRVPDVTVARLTLKQQPHPSEALEPHLHSQCNGGD